MKLFIESLLERRLLIGKRWDKGISLRADLQKYHGKSLIESQPGLGKWVSGEMFGNGGGALAVTLDERVAFVCFLALEPCDCLGNGAPGGWVLGAGPIECFTKAVEPWFYPG